MSLLITALVMESSEKIFGVVFYPFSFLLEEHGSMHEWRFRSQLDCYVTLMGIVTALVVRSGKIRGSVFRWIVAGCLSVCGIVWWYVEFYHVERHEYNKIHRYVATIPITAFLVC